MLLHASYVKSQLRCAKYIYICRYQFKAKYSLTGSATFGLSMQSQHGIYFEIQIKLQYANNNPDTNKATDANTNP